MSGPIEYERAHVRDGFPLRRPPVWGIADVFGVQRFAALVLSCRRDVDARSGKAVDLHSWHQRIVCAQGVLDPGPVQLLHRRCPGRDRIRVPMTPGYGLCGLGVSCGRHVAVWWGA